MVSIQNLNCILVIDKDVALKMKSSVSNLIVYGVDIVENIRDLKEDMLRKTRKVVLVGEYKYDGLDDIRLHKEVLNLDIYLISTDELLISLMSDFCKCYNLEYTNLTSGLIYSVLYEDLGEQDKYKNISSTMLEPTLARELLNRVSDPTVSEICKSYLRLRDILDTKLTLERNNKIRIRQLESQMIQHLSEINTISESYSDLVGKVLTQTKVLNDYKIILTKDIYEKVSLSKYKKRPKIIYIKEYQEIIHEHSFLMALQNSITIQAKKSCKLIRLHDSYDVVRIKTLERMYKVLNNEYLESEVITNDMILSYGNYKRLLDLLLENKESLDVLIIYDCKKYNDVVLSGVDMIYFSSCRSEEVAKHLGLNLNNTITNNSSGPMSWDTYREYSEFKDTKERFEFLSSRPIIQRIYSLVTSPLI